MNWLRRHLPVRSVTLVIDDGPTAATERLLDALADAGHRAVLFILGCNVAGREAVLADAVGRGFALGNHSFSHPAFSEISLAQARDELAQTETLIDRAYRTAGVGRTGRWFRFPYLDRGGARAAEFQALLAELDFSVPAPVKRRCRDRETGRDWPTTIVTRDWDLPPEATFRATMRTARAGDAIEFHDKQDTVARLLNPLVEELARGRLRATVPSP